MYEKGCLKLLDPPCGTMDAEGWCEEWHENHTHTVTDSRGGGTFITPEICAFLPHSCDEWVIGGEKEIEMLIEDLKAVLAGLKICA